MSEDPQPASNSGLIAKIEIIQRPVNGTVDVTENADGFTITYKSKPTPQPAKSVMNTREKAISAHLLLWSGGAGAVAILLNLIKPFFGPASIAHVTMQEASSLGLIASVLLLIAHTSYTSGSTSGFWHHQFALYRAIRGVGEVGILAFAIRVFVAFVDPATVVQLHTHVVISVIGATLCVLAIVGNEVFNRFKPNSNNSPDNG
jgi:hypothetical protein